MAIFLFDTTHDAMQAEEAIIEGGFWNELVPRPPDSANTLCGLAIAVEPGDREEITSLLAGEGIRFQQYEPAGT
ncbi:MAG: DUF3343 domain-containing protein [Thermoleophilia bacterium]|nr:DUF3343 domain-containing protein [Thermoleophilia bacterium]